MTHTLKSLLSFRAIFVVLAVLAVLYFFFGSMNGITTAGKALQNRAENYVASGLGDEFRLDQAEAALEEARDQLGAQASRVAGLTVDCEDTQEEVEQYTTQFESASEHLRALHLATQRARPDRPTYFHAKAYTIEELNDAMQPQALVVHELNSRLSMKRELLQMRQTALGEAKKQLGNIQQRLAKLELALETSRVDAECVRLLNESVGTDVDASQLAFAEDVLKDVDRDLRQQRVALNMMSGQPGSELVNMGVDPEALVDGALALIGVQAKSGEYASSFD